MAGRRVLVDTDLFIILAASGLLDPVLDRLGCARSDARRLDPLPHMARHSKRLRAKHDAATLMRVIAEAGTIASIDEAPPVDDLVALQNVPNIDAGDALLYAVVSASDAYYLASNDKRAMRALCASPDLRPIRDRVAGRVIVLESVLAALMPGMGVAACANAIAPILHTDTMLQVVFTKHNLDHPEQAIQTANSYLAALRQELGDDFLYTL